MSENTQKYDLILQNNASKEFFLYPGLADTSTSHLYHKLDVELDIPAGEYTYAVLPYEPGVEYDFKTPVLDTMVILGDEEAKLGLLQPCTGLLRVGESIKQENIYDDNKKQTIYYYEG